jgi:hypothetical protein
MNKKIDILFEMVKKTLYSNSRFHLIIQYDINVLNFEHQN